MKSILLTAVAMGNLLTLPQVFGQITYVDADLTNTLIAGDAPDIGVNLTSPDRPNGDGLWGYDSDSNFANPTPTGGAIWAGGSSDGDLPELTTTITGLTPGGLYEIYAFGWTVGTTWDMSAGLESGNLTQFRDGPAGDYYALGDRFTNPTPDPSTISAATIDGVEYTFTTPLETSEGNRDVYLCQLGLTLADGSGNIPVYISTYGGGDRTWYDGVGYRPITNPPVNPPSATVTLGEELTFDASISSGGTFSFQWKKDGVDIPGETNSTLTIAAADSSDAGNYSATITYSGGTLTTLDAPLTVNVPAVTPTVQVGIQGTSRTFSVSMPETASYSYQWRKDSIAIPGATDATLVVSNISSADAGLYDVEVTLAGDPVASSGSGELIVPSVPTGSYDSLVLSHSPIAYLRLGEAAGSTEALDETTPMENFSVGFSTLLEQPGAILGSSDTAMGFDGTEDSILEGSEFDGDLNPATFSVEFWARPTGGTGQRTVFGSRDLFSTTTIEGYEVGLDAAGNWVFRTGQGEVTEAGADPWNTLTGSSAAFGSWSHVVATFDGTEMALYVNGILEGTLTTTAFTPQTAWESRIGAGANEELPALDFFTGDIDELAIYGTALSTSQTLEHYAAAFDPTAPPVISIQPATTATLIGEPTSLMVEVATGSALTYQWRKDGTDIPGANSATLTFDPLSLGDAGNYDIVISNVNGSITSNVASLVPLQDYLGTVVTPDASNTILVADDFSPWFSNNQTTADLDGLWFQRDVFAILPSITPYGYQATANTAGATNGETEVQTTISGLSPNTDYAVWTLISYKPGFSTGLQAGFAGDPIEPILIGEMNDTGLGSVALPGSGGDTWNILHGLVGIQTSDSAGEIKVNVDYLPGSGRTVYNGLGYQLAVPAASAPTITVPPSNLSAICGSEVTFTASASSVEAMTYQWQKDGVNIVGETATSLTLSNIDETDAGDYTFVATNSQGSTVSAAGTLVTLLDYIGEFVFPDSSNTVLTRNDSSVFSDSDQIAAEDAGLWTERTDIILPGYSTNSYYATELNESTTEVNNELRTTITGLTPGEDYAVWVLFAFNNGADRISASLDGNSLITFEETLASYIGLNTGAAGDLGIYHGLLGVREADTNGEISALVDFNGLTRSMYLGLGYQTAVLSSIPELTIDIESSGGVTTITWPVGTLQKNADLSNPNGWIDIPGAVSPYSEPTATARNFFRVQK